MVTNPYGPGAGLVPIPPQEQPSGGPLSGFLQHMPPHIGWFGPHGGGIWRGGQIPNPGIQPGGNPRNPAEGIQYNMVDPAAILHQVYQNMLQQQQVQNVQNAIPGGGMHPVDIQAQAAKLAQIVAGARGKPGPRLRPIRTAPEPTQLFHNPSQHRQVGPPPMNPGMGSY